MSDSKSTSSPSEADSRTAAPQARAGGDVDREIAEFQTADTRLREEIGRLLLGQSDVVDRVVAAFFAGGHALIEGVPGTGKTFLVRSLAQAAGVEFGRVQFTPDLLPADILGCDTLVSGDGRGETIEFRPGPVFTQFLLADEINRGTPRAQSALLEAMEERSVTSGRERHALDPMFTVFATRNPIEMEGTYPLPEAQLDRFLLEVSVPPPARAELVRIALATTGAETPSARPVLDSSQLPALRQTVRNVVATEDILAFGARLIDASQPTGESSPRLVRECVRYGGGVRALQALVLLGKVTALRAGRPHLAKEDFRPHLLSVLRHRLLWTLDGEVSGVSPEDVSRAILEAAKTA